MFLKQQIVAVTYSRLRTSIVTVLVSCDGVDIETLASSFMKHKASTCQEYYVIKYAKLDAARIS